VTVMQTPQGELLAEFEARLGSMLQTISCPRCNGLFNSKTVQLSLHVFELPNCVGPGAVIKRELPWCPKCETEPFDVGCLHLELAVMAMLKPSINLPGEDITRCDFCLKAVASIDQLKICEVELGHETAALAALREQLRMLASGAWGACGECAALIEAKKLTELVERCLTGFMKLYSELPPNAVEPLRTRITVTCILLFGNRFR
jgi:hypothetical protein